MEQYTFLFSYTSSVTNYLPSQSSFRPEMPGISNLSTKWQTYT